jgi:5-methylcytosine-specific restriction endonuclease McrA
MKIGVKSIKEAENQHFMFFDYYISRKFNKEVIKYNSNLKSYHRLSNLEDPYIQHLSRFLFAEDTKNKKFYQKVIGVKPQELYKLNTEFINFIDNLFCKDTYETYLSLEKAKRNELKDIHDFFLTIEKIFNYDELTDALPNDAYSAYQLTKNIGVRTCVYCNRVYAITHNTKEGGKLMRPQLDHWFPQSKYPLLAISFYNLIPSCTHCNSSVKGDKELDLKKHTNPYLVNDEDDDFLFTYQFNKSLREFEIQIQKTGSGTKNKDTLEFLKINEMYDAHQDELEDLLKIKQAYSREYVKTLRTTFPEANLTDDEIYRLAFGVELHQKDFHKRPMSKFKYDILKELGIIP